MSEQGKFITSVYRKSTFSGVYTHFDSFIPDTYKIGMNYTLVDRYFWICSCWFIVPSTIDTLKKSILEKWLLRKLQFTFFLNGIHIVKEKVPAVEKKPLWLVLPYLGLISLQTKPKLLTSIKWVLNYCRLQVIFKIQNKLYNNFCIKDPIS